MSELFFINEILKFALEREQESFDLYNKLEEQATDQNVKDLFNKLKQEEVKHKDYYKEIFDSLEQKQSPGVKEDGEYNAYMKAMIDEGRKISKNANLDLNDLNQVISYAIDREKDAVLFYVGLKGMVKLDNQDKIQEIIQEEGKHIVWLVNFKAML